jgi:endonuclease/exonuclease/phosphatase family metal-dependent hydrolase
MTHARRRNHARTVLLLVTLGLVGAGCAAARRDTAPPTALRIATYNIKHGRGMDDSVDLARTAFVLRALAPDIVGLQEVDRNVRRSGGVDEPSVLGAMLDMQHAFGAFMPYQGGEYGLAVLSRFPITRATPIRLPDGNEPRVALAAELRLPDGRALMVVNVHFDWVENDTFRLEQAAALTSVLDTLRMPYVLLGDFNDEPGSRTLALFQARATEVKKPASDRFTFSSTEPLKEIDFVFVAPAGAWRAIGARPVAERLASDHRPVIAEVELRARRR